MCVCIIFLVFENLTELQLSWWFRGINDWDEVVKMLQNCPKLQTVNIIKVCLSHQWIVTVFLTRSYLPSIFTNPIVSLIDKKDLNNHGPLGISVYILQNASETFIGYDHLSYSSPKSNGEPSILLVVLTTIPPKLEKYSHIMNDIRMHRSWINHNSQRLQYLYH